MAGDSHWGKGKAKLVIYKLGDGKVALYEKDWQRDGAEVASIHEAGQLAHFRLADSGGVTRMVWLKARKYKNI